MGASVDVTSFDEDLRTFSHSIGEVLQAECDRRKLHAYFDGTNDLEHALWHRAKELGWFAIGVSEELGGLGMGSRGLDVLFRSLGRNVAPGPFHSTLAARSGCRSARRLVSLRSSSRGSWLASFHSASPQCSAALR